jgi:Flp pilus assembly pilin Flp
MEMPHLILLAWKLLREQDGQDLVEYTLLLCFVILAAAAIFPVVSMSMQFLWQAINSHLMPPPGSAPR